MDKVLRQANIGLNAKDAFDYFVLNLNDWWPREYTWSRDSLKDIRIDARADGLCTEIGPDGFRCDWGACHAIYPWGIHQFHMADRAELGTRSGSKKGEQGHGRFLQKRKR